MPGEQLTEDTVRKVFDSNNTAKIEDFFSKWNFANTTSAAFRMNEGEKNVLGDKICEKIEIDELSAILLETIRLISRERQGLDSLLNKELCEKIIVMAGLTLVDGYPKTTHALMEAQKCLINTMFHSAKMREHFYANPDVSENILMFLTEFEESRRKKSQIQWIRDLNQTQAADVWYFYHRIAFIATAMSKELQEKWSMKSTIVDTLLLAVDIILDGRKEISKLDYDRASEAMKTFFNIFCRFDRVLEIMDDKNATKSCQVLRDVILSDLVTDEIRENAVHALSVPPVPMMLNVLCSDPAQPIPTNSEQQNFRDLNCMQLTETVLTALDKQLTRAVALLNATPPGEPCRDGQTLVDLVGPYFQFLARLCTESKHVRRYCRIRVLPPLVADEVKKRPEEHDTMRGRIVRVMMLPSTTKEVASEFLFIICKRSVNRMIKYVGFGHSAGHLANMGLLGQINQPKHASDSEDSETEDYNAVKDSDNSSVNPVTGAMYPPDHGSALAGMSDEQKEYEAMKLVDAMNKMMDQGLVKPGTIGEDGRLREVSHVLELIKDAPEQKGSDSDSD